MASSKSVQVLVKRKNPDVTGIPDFTKGILKRLMLTVAGLRGCDHVERVLQVAHAREDVRNFLFKLEAHLWEAENMGHGAKVIAEAPTPAVYNIIDAAITLRNDADKEVAASIAAAEAAEATAPVTEPAELPPAAKKVRGKRAKGIEPSLADLMAMEVAMEMAVNQL